MDNLPSEEQVEDFWNSTEKPEALPEKNEPHDTGDEQVTLTQEEYDELKKGQMLQADYTRKRQEESERVRELERQLAEEREIRNYEESEAEVELQADLDDSGLPESVKEKVTEIDRIKRELEEQRSRQAQEATRRKADRIIKNLEEIEKEYPALKNKAVKFSVMAYASQVLNNSTLSGLKDAASEISKAYDAQYEAQRAQLKNDISKRRATSPSIGSGGSAPVRTVDAPKNLTEANELVLDALGKIDLFGPD
tara:strand:+ start:14473 stop:15228 length:756 start_codon:yes stop_codon:yes gene_type:complete